MKVSDIKIERSLSFTGSQWDALIMSCCLALHCCDVLLRDDPVKYAGLQADISSCYSSVLKAVFGDEVFASKT